jgi:hypothetical protein
MFDLKLNSTFSRVLIHSGTGLSVRPGAGLFLKCWLDDSSTVALMASMAMIT